MSTFYRYVLSAIAAEMKTAMMVGMNLAIWSAAIGLLVCALRMRRSGVLR